jgi:hypothetical protein
MKNRYITLLQTVNRPGIFDLIDYLENKTDFFSAPSSTRFHGAFEGGLLIHSLNVFDCLMELSLTPAFSSQNLSHDSIVIASLLHDLCKTNFYKISYRNAKNKEGVWVQVPFYEVEDTHPYGHGECSVMLAEQFIKLTDDEKYAIRWHMGGFDESVRGGSYALGAAYKKYPLTLALHMADMTATYIYEKEAK